MTRYRDRPRDIPYMLAVKQLPCCIAHLHICRGLVEADHAGERPLGRKAADDTCIPLCRYGHQCRHARAGYFRDFTRAQMREWCDARIAETRATVAAQFAEVA